jgi:hypothetical protein
MLSPATLASVSAGAARIGQSPSVQTVRTPPVAASPAPAASVFSAQGGAAAAQKPATGIAPSVTTPPPRGLPRGSLLDLSV